MFECPGQKTKTVNQHGTSIELGKTMLVSCLSGIAYGETKRLALLALLYKLPAVESSAQFSTLQTLGCRSFGKVIKSSAGESSALL